MLKPTVYLAGPITGLSYTGATDWRKLAYTWLKARGIRGLDPMRGKQYLLGETKISAKGYDETLLSNEKAITTRDRFDTQRADVIIMNLLGATKISAGTMIEMGWADSVRTPVILVMEKNGSNPHDHAMVRSIAGYWVESLEEAVDIAASILG